MRARIMGIESSCDETAAAVVADGREILSNVVASQVEVHRKYGGVVPELASREHLRKIVPVVREALEQARLSMTDLDAIAVTRGPGLVGSLLVGLTYGKVLALSLGKPLVPVNHLEGHIHAVLLEAYGRGRQLEFPAVALVVSGGHTVLYRVEVSSGTRDPWPGQLTYRRLGQTRDDAAGEAYDKVAKLLALGYPGGPVIDELAESGGGKAAGQAPRFKPTKIKGHPYDFSFSGIKTAVLYYLRAHPEFQQEIDVRRQALASGVRKADQLRPLCSEQTLALVRSFQRAVVEDLIAPTLAAADESAARAVLVSGGVAANQRLRFRFEEEARAKSRHVFFPSRLLSTDNAAMIAAAAYSKLLAGECAGAELNADASLPLG